MNAMAGFNIHRGCLAIGERPAAAAVGGAGTAGALRPARSCSSAVANADNVGATFRAAAAFGAGGVLLDSALRRSALPQGHPHVDGRGAPGAVRAVRPWPGALIELRERRLDVVGLTPAAADRCRCVLGAVARARRVVLVLGHEGDGLTRRALARVHASRAHPDGGAAWTR